MRRRRLELILDLTSRCNIHCIMCYFSTTDRLRFKPFDLDPDQRGNMGMDMFRHVASELLPYTRKIGLGCAAEPLLHPGFAEMLALARSHRVPDTWIQTNLLALTPATAEAIVGNGVRTVAVSIDGTSRETYETIRRGASWERLHEKLQMLRDVKTAARSALPRLRITFVWMRSNREDLATLPGFAEGLGASELDVRFVAPTVSVDNSGELLESEDPDAIMRELWSVARAATDRGIRLSAYPSLRKEADADDTVLGKIGRKLWLLKSGIDGPGRWRRSFLERRDGCSFPGRTLLIRPNGAVLPCPFWEEEPVAVVPGDGRVAILESEGIGAIRRGLRDGCPVGSCRTCIEKKDALFRPTNVQPDRPEGREPGEDGLLPGVEVEAVPDPKFDSRT
jgi:MoaA/NifB/PqqE/SkfB family radical SAM enzyme